MGRYIIGRLLRGAVSVVIVVCVVTVLVYGCLDRNLIFAQDSVFSRQKNNARQVYKLQQWEDYGYVDYVSFGDYLQGEGIEGSVLGDTAQEDDPVTKGLVERFTLKYSGEGYQVERLDAMYRGGTKKYLEGGEPRLYAYRDVPLAQRVVRYLAGLVTVDNIHAAEGVMGERGLTFTLYDPAYSGERFSPAIMGNGTRHRYLLYFDDRFPFLHQNLITVRLGRSWSVDRGVDVVDTMTAEQGNRVLRPVTYPSGLQTLSADDLHSAIYVEGSYEAGDAVVRQHFVDDYTAVTTRKQGMSKVGYSFVVGIVAVSVAYVLAVLMAIRMVRRRGGLADRSGTAFIVSVMAVPALAYIFLLRAIGGRLGLPTAFDADAPRWQMLVLPAVSLALPAAASLMRWLRRYMTDHMDTESIRFARASGLEEGQIFRQRVLRNAAIPLVHGIPASILGALVGAIITERVYAVPGAGDLLTGAIGAYDNGVIVGVTLYYAVLSVAAAILGDLLLAAADPRISLEGGR